MKNILRFFLKKDLSTLFTIIAAVLSFGFMIAYVNTGITEFNDELEIKAIVFSIVTGVLGILFALFEVKTGRYLAFIIQLYVLVSYIKGQANYIGNVFTSIDGSTFSAGFIITALLLVVSIGLFLAGAIMCDDELEILRKEKANEAVHE